MTIRTATLLILSTAATAQAAVSFVSDRASLGANDIVDWGQFPFYSYSLTVPSGTTAWSQHGMGVVLSNPSGMGFGRLDEGNGAHGNFTLGDHLLHTAYGYGGPMTFTFPEGIYGAGAQVQTERFGGFTGTIEAFAQDGSSLGLFDFSGWSHALQDNTAVFAGVASDLPEIFSVTFTAFNGTPNFTINQLSLLSPEQTPVVPEPSTVLAGLLLLVPVAWGVRRR